MRKDNISRGSKAGGLKDYVEALHKLRIEYRGILEACSGSIISLDEWGKVIFWNRAAEDMFGYSRKEMLGKSPEMLIIEKDRERYTRMFKILKRLGAPKIAIEVQCVKKDGKEIPVEFSISPSRTKHTRSFVAVARDLVKRKDIEEKLRESEKRYHTMVEHAYDLIWMLDTQGKFTYINKTAEKVSGYPLDELMGESFAPIVVSKDLPRVREVFERTLKGKSLTSTMRIYNSRGEILTLDINAAPIRKGGEIVGTVIFGRNITRQRELLAKIRKSEKLYKLLLDFNRGILNSSPAGIMKLNGELRIEYESPEMKRIMGVHPEGESREMGMDIRDVPSIKEAGLVPQLNKLVGGEEISGEVPFSPVYGRETYITFRGVPIVEDSKFAGAVLLLNDITELKRREERYTSQLRSLIDIGDKMRLELGFEAILQNICDIVVNTLGWRQVVLSLRDYGKGISRAVAVAGYDEKKSREILARQPIPLISVEKYLRDEFKISRSYYIDHTHWDVLKDYPGGFIVTPVSDLLPGGWHERDALLVPIYGKERILGFISPDNPMDGRRPTENDIRLFEIFADQAGVVIESSRLYAELQASEERYRTLVETTGEGIILVDGDGNIIFANQAIADILGYRKNELVGTNLSNLTNQKEFSRFWKGTVERKKEKSGKYETVLYSSMFKEGIPHRFIVSVVPLFKPNGTYAASMAVLTDITEREKMKKALEESEKKYRAVCENSLMAIYILQDGKLRFVNKRLEHLSGYSREELLGKEFWKLVHPDDREVVKNGLWGEKGESAIPNYEFRGIKKNGELIWFDAIASTVEYQGREAVLGNLIDITYRKEAALELERYMVKLEELNESKSRFISTLSHDIRTPLSTISGYVSLLLSKRWGDLTPEQENRMHRILESIRYLDDLVDGILDLSRIESGKTPITPQNFNPVEVIERSIEDFATASKEREQSIEFTGDRSIDNAYADPKAMRQILNNLIGNAVKYTPRKGKIEVSLVENDKFIQVNVKDNGQGISKEEHDKIFQEFYRIADQSGEVKKSKGLGLSIVKRLVETMGGTVWVDSEGLDKGSTFSFTLKKT
ncbi:hypothetical protein CH333_05900 [candidate division WOR-3 bacterium JGI_Cruoil_03_44_89]|uniref:histidine kinase n=1 Tax=candidate division WOR-3 bacterium JGI_Cruoil_03_44_89 TaxID=1973748 RepID=A0A235BT23_UNCW3|nr:MAG: hypothetical protein CH333_05900 [candidate division WOR-3 bacterium JGI_Cruoil_03_44_89]